MSMLIILVRGNNDVPLFDVSYKRSKENYFRDNFRDMLADLVNIDIFSKHLDKGMMKTAIKFIKTRKMNIVT